MQEEILRARVPQELYDQVWDEAQKDKKSMSSTIRELVQEALFARYNHPIVNVPIIGKISNGKIGLTSGKSGPAFEVKK